MGGLTERSGRASALYRPGAYNSRNHGSIKPSLASSCLGGTPVSGAPAPFVVVVLDHAFLFPSVRVALLLNRP